LLSSAARRQVFYISDASYPIAYPAGFCIILLPSSFGDLVASLHSISPDDRPPDAASVLQRLDEVRHASNVNALIDAGESDVIEYKSSLHHRYDPLPMTCRTW
jgi:hypothetical protein